MPVLLRSGADYLPSLPPPLACSLSFSFISSVILHYLFRVVSSGTSVCFSILLPRVCDGNGGQPVCLRPNYSGHYWKFPNQRLWKFPTKLIFFKKNIFWVILAFRKEARLHSAGRQGYLSAGSSWGKSSCDHPGWSSGSPLTDSKASAC